MSRDPAPIPSCVLALQVQPRAARDAIVGRHGPAIKLRITAPPVDGQANAAIIRFLAKRLGLPASALKIVRGAHGKQKWLAIAGLDEAAALTRLGLAASDTDHDTNTGTTGP